MILRLAVALLRRAGWTVRPPCVECDARYPCRMVTDEDDLGQCALAANLRRS